jgi:hypothetical protein
VDTDSSAVVQYAYSTDDNNSRLISMTYPGGRQIDYSYGSIDGENGTELDDAISRVTSIIDDATSVHLVDYQYLGMNTIVDAANPQAGTDMTYIGGRGNGVRKYFSWRSALTTALLWDRGSVRQVAHIRR